MQRDLDAIEAYAERRLTLPAGVHPSGEVKRYKAYLEHFWKRLRLQHRQGRGGREICLLRAAVLDALLAKIAEALQNASEKPPARTVRTWALVALGGYGRGELNPCSDLDIMLLLSDDRFNRKEMPVSVELFTTGLAWDILPKVGHSVRSVEDCVREANGDMQTKTSLVEARFICGNESLFKQMRKAVVARCVKGHENEYIDQRIADQNDRRRRFGNTPCLQEPNIKNGCGGLRDYQNLLWMTFFKYRSRTLVELEERQLINAKERETLEEAYDFLLRVRTTLHYTTGRPDDVLYRHHQPAVARGLNYPERQPRARLESFMSDYYQRARQMYFITRTLEQRLALLPQPKRLPTLKHFLRNRRVLASYVLDGFRFVSGQIRADHPNIFREEPARLLRVFRQAQLRGLSLDPDLARIISNDLHLVDGTFRKDAHIRDTFLAILNERGNVAPTLRAMHEVGLLGRYLPAFGKLTNLVQHEFYHQYTADEHTLTCVEKLDRVAGASKEPLARYREVFERLERPFILYLALLLHDVGKAKGGPDHTLTGGRIALSVARRLKLDHVATHQLERLVSTHLVMVQVSQRRDVEAAGEIRKFAATVENEVLLDQLTLLTLADSLGTSDKLWSGHKNELLWTLYHNTSQYLAGSEKSVQADARLRAELLRQVTRLHRRQAGAVGPAQPLEREQVRAHFGKLPPRYFRLRTAPEILADILLVRRFLDILLDPDAHPFQPVIAWRHDRDRGFSELKVCTWDRHGLFTRIAGALTAAELNILSAEVFTREDDLVIDTFLVTDAATGSPVSEKRQRRVDRLLNDTLVGRADLTVLIRREWDKFRSQPHLEELGSEMALGVRFDNEVSKTRTVIEVEARDRPGLLYELLKTLVALEVDISVAKISTEKGVANDSFYVQEFDRGKIRSKARQCEIRERLLARLEELAPAKSTSA